MAQQIYDRPRGEDAASRVLMLLEQAGKEPRQRVLYNYAKDKGQAERQTLLRFVEPAKVEGTGLLTLDYAGEDSDQWLYLPALDRVRRISSGRKGGRFVGSDFFYEDLRDREAAMDRHRLLGNERLGEVDCLLLESVPLDDKSSVYTRRLSWIDPEKLLPLRVDYFQKNHTEPSKRLSVSDIRKVQGYWTAFETVMVELESGHRSRLLIQDIKYDQNLPDDLFSRLGLADPNRERAYRP